MNGNQNQNTAIIDPGGSTNVDPGNKDPILVDPIINKVKLSNYLTAESAKNFSLPIDSVDKNIILNGGFNEFSSYIKDEYYFAGKEIPSDEELNTIYNSFRDLDAEEIQRNKLKTNYILDEVKKNKLENIDGINLPSEADATIGVPSENILTGKEVKTYYPMEGLPSPGPIGFTGFRSGEDSKFDRNQWKIDQRDAAISFSGNPQSYFDVSEKNLKIFNENDIWQNVYKINSAKSNSNNPEFNYSFRVNGAFGKSIDGLGVEFIFNDAVQAAQKFNQKFNIYGITAEAKSTKGGPFEGAQQSIVIIDDKGDVMFEQRLFGDKVLGIDKQKVVETIGSPLDEEVRTGISFLGGAVIRPELYTQEFQEFKMKLMESGRSRTPILNLAREFQEHKENDDPGIFLLRDHFFNMTELPLVHNRMIVRLAGDFGLNLNPLDLYDMKKGIGDENLYDPMKVMQWIKLIRAEVNKEDDTPGKEIIIKNQDVQMDKTGGLFDSFQYAYDFGVNGSEQLNHILNMDAGINDTLIDQHGNESTKKDLINKVLDHYTTQIRSRMNLASRNVGLALRINGNYKEIPLEGPLSLLSFSELRGMGMNTADHFPTEGIMIDGRPSTYEEFYNVITDPTLNNEVRMNRIKVEIGNPNDYGIMSTAVERAQSLFDRNETSFLDSSSELWGIDNKWMLEILNAGDRTANWFEDVLQGVGIELLDISASVKEIMKDKFRMFGYDDATVEAIFNLPPTGLGPSTSMWLDKDDVEELREDYLPLWSTNITDFDSLSEFVALANQPFSQSIPYVGAFMLNPKLGLAVVGVNAYGENLYGYHQRQDAAESMDGLGYALTETELNMMNTGDWAVRGLSLSQAGIETAFTAMFTMRYFRNFHFLKNKTPKHLRTKEYVDKLAKEYSMRFDKGFNAELKRIYNIEGRALVFENAEEGNIAYWSYVFESAMGLQEYSHERAGELLKETAYVTSFSSLGMAKGLRITSKHNLNSSASILIEESIGNGKYYTLVDQNINIKSWLEGYVADQKDKGKTDQQIKNSKWYKWANDHLTKIQGSLKTMEQQRKDLVADLSKEDKIRFLDHMAEIVSLEARVNSNAHTAYSRLQSIEDIRAHQFALGQIVNGVGTKAAFEYLHYTDKAFYITEAYGETPYEEWLEKNPNGKKVDWENSIYDLAVEKYINNVKEQKEDNDGFVLPVLDLWMAPAYGNTNPNSIVSLDLDPEYTKTFDLTAELKNASNSLINQVTNLFDPSQVPGQEVEQDGKKQEGSIPPERIELKGKIQSLVDKINKFNVGENNEFMNNLTDLDRKFIKKFFQSINKPKEGQALVNPRDYALQRVSAIVEAYSIALELERNLDAPIDIFPEGTMKGFLKTFAGDYSGIWSILPKDNAGNRNIATLDVLKNLPIRNKIHAKGFLDLYARATQKVAEAKGETEGLYLDLLTTYFKGKGENVTDRSVLNLWLTKNQKSVTIEDDYEMSILSGLGRINLDLKEGQDSEFTRYKNNLLQELEQRKIDMNNSTLKNKKINTEKYNILKKVIDKLNIESATSYEQVLKYASKHNIDVVEKIRGIFKAMEQQSKDRVHGFGQKWTNFENYMPLFLKPIENDGSHLNEMQYEDSTSETAGRINTTGSLQYATVPDSYINEGFRLNLGDYMKNAFHSVKGTKMDGYARQDVMTMYNLFNSPLFKKQFSNASDFQTFKSLFGDHFLKSFNYEVNRGRNPYTDYGDNNIMNGDPYKSLLAKVDMTVNSTLSVASATALASFTQPTQQFYSALGNNMIRVESWQAKRLLLQKMALFPIGLAGVSNGTKNKGYTSQLIQDLFGQGDKSNIYALSRTSLRNAITAELPLEQNASRDVSYYANTLGIDLGKLGKYGIKGSYTVDQFLKSVQQNSELALEIFLARADKAAANAAFEAHYLDFRIRNGATYPKDNKGRMAWWKKENDNPNRDAINHADALVSELMRSTGDMTEAGIYKSDQGFGTKNFLRTFMPFAKFSLNAKTNYWVQHAIANDPTVPPQQRREARDAMAGILTEIATFQGIKVTMQSAMYGTLASVLMGFDDDEIERLEGGLHYVLKSIHLPIDDVKFMQKFHEELKKSGTDDMRSMEALNAYVKVYLQGAIGEEGWSGLEDLMNYGNTYGNKVNLTPKNNNVFQAIVQDVIRTMNPLVVPEFVNTATFGIINHLARESGIIDQESNIFLEYFSEDIEREWDSEKTGISGTLSNLGNITPKFISEHLGLFGIVGDQYNKVMKSMDLMERNAIVKEFNGVETTQYVGSGSILINEKIDKAIGVLAISRILIAFGRVPGTPSAELTRYLDKVERGLEMYMTTTESAISGSKQSEGDPLMREGWLRYFENLEKENPLNQ